jgi:hypothetical protein
LAASLAMIFNGAAILALLLLFIGLLKPCWVLWWADTQYRLKAIILYGGLAAFFYLISRVIEGSF